MSAIIGTIASGGGKLPTITGSGRLTLTKNSTSFTQVLVAPRDCIATLYIIVDAGSSEADTTKLSDIYDLRLNNQGNYLTYGWRIRNYTPRGIISFPHLAAGVSNQVLSALPSGDTSMEISYLLKSQDHIDAKMDSTAASYFSSGGVYIYYNLFALS